MRLGGGIVVYQSGVRTSAAVARQLDGILARALKVVDIPRLIQVPVVDSPAGGTA